MIIMVMKMMILTLMMVMIMMILTVIFKNYDNYCYDFDGDVISDFRYFFVHLYITIFCWPYK